MRDTTVVDVDVVVVVAGGGDSCCWLCCFFVLLEEAVRAYESYHHYRAGNRY